MTADDLDLLQQLATEGQIKTDAENARDQALARIRDLVPRAAALGIPKAEIARRAQVSEQTVYTILRDAGR